MNYYLFLWHHSRFPLKPTHKIKSYHQSLSEGKFLMMRIRTSLNHLSALVATVSIHVFLDWCRHFPAKCMPDTEKHTDTTDGSHVCLHRVNNGLWIKSKRHSWTWLSLPAAAPWPAVSSLCLSLLWRSRSRLPPVSSWRRYATGTQTHCVAFSFEPINLSCIFAVW